MLEAPKNLWENGSVVEVVPGTAEESVQNALHWAGEVHSCDCSYILVRRFGECFKSSLVDL